MRLGLKRLVGALSLALMTSGALGATSGANVTRATLDNGLHVVIVRDALAPW